MGLQEAVALVIVTFIIATYLFRRRSRSAKTGCQHCGSAALHCAERAQKVTLHRKS